MAAIGIYVGTRYACAGVWKDGGVNIIPNENLQTTTPPSLVFVENINIDIYDDLRSLLGVDGNPSITLKYNGEDRQFSAEQFCSILIGKMKQIAELYLGSEVTKAVITVPADFMKSKVDAIKLAGSLAGLNVMEIIQEPIAAATAYDFDKENLKNVVIFDLGASSLHVALVLVIDSNLGVLSQTRDRRFGGVQFDTRMVVYLVSKFNKKHGKNISRDSNALSRLKIACERAKRTLSTATEATVMIESLYDGIDFEYIISRSMFESLNNDLFNECAKVARQFVIGSGKKKSTVSSLVLVGGSTRIPMLQKLLKGVCWGHGIVTLNSINPEEVVAYGATIRAAILNNDIAPRNLFGIQSLLDTLTRKTFLSLEGEVDSDVEEEVDEYTVNALKIAEQIPINYPFEISAVEQLKETHGFVGEVIPRGSKSSYHKHLKAEAVKARLNIAPGKLPAMLRAPLNTGTELTDSDTD